MLRFNKLIIFTLLFSLKASALIDLKNANYADSWIDLIIPGTGYDLKVQRGYNSRTLFNGIFGFGWCSDFETSLEVTAEGNLLLTECGAGLEVLYQAGQYSEGDIQKVVKQIIAKARAENLSAQPNYWADLEKRLQTETALRAEYAAKYKIAKTIAEKTRYYANGKEADYMERQGSSYVRVMPDGVTQKFDLKGRLSKLFDRNGNFLNFSYNGKLLAAVTDNNGRKLSFSYYPNGKVKLISAPGGLKAEYKYQNLNELIYAKIADGSVYTYDYDSDGLHNLTKITYPNKTTKEINYNKNKDWVVSLKDTDGCVEKYDYIQSQDDPKNHYWSTIEKKCQSKVVVKGKYEFWYDIKSDKTGRYLKKSRTIENTTTTDVVYNELGRPLVITKNSKSTKFEYYPDGLLHKKTTPDGITTTLYYNNSFKKVSKLVRQGKTSEYTYDAKGNLILAKNSDGQKITLGYDPKGRVAFIEDQAKRKVKLKYDERFGKANLIEREGVGSIKLVYNNQGEFVKAEPLNGGEAAAKQVASTFYNFVELTQVSGVTLNF
ncbi:MAG: RHS repeat protein [Oligoflexia bacterium]|nr:RHS repeat protein [Oligoflexia bacterium]